MGKRGILIGIALFVAAAAITPTLLFLYKNNARIDQAISMGNKFYAFFTDEAEYNPESRLTELRNFTKDDSKYGILAKFRLASLLASIGNYQESLEIYSELKLTSDNTALKSLAEYMCMLLLFKSGDNSKLEQELIQYNQKIDNKAFYRSVKSLEAVFYASKNEKKKSDQALFEMENNAKNSKQLLGLTKEVVGLLLTTNEAQAK